MIGCNCPNHKPLDIPKIHQMKLHENIVRFWGVMDLAAIGWYVGFGIIDGKIPFYSDFASAKLISRSFEAPMQMIFASISLFWYSTLFVSGLLLFKCHKYGAILSYLQCPFRLLAFMPISLFFLTWPVKHLFGMPLQKEDLSQAFFQVPVIVFLFLRLFSEILKMTTVVRWHVKINRSVSPTISQRTG